uniref:Kinesin motor domain-containing protein n=1 Tax=Plectus sambesii TaxID=2011161 RepID=A0A914X733_9BILA
MADNVKVAVRVRPFNKREQELGTKLVVAMEAEQTVLSHPNDDIPKYAIALLETLHPTTTTTSTLSNMRRGRTLSLVRLQIVAALERRVNGHKRGLC